ncbi:MAG: hypothetical protein Q8P81_04470 [Nanoarchaeota archaeon]|nr:hypothetical protein [Nanoarchaeota archaeon]
MNGTSKIRRAFREGSLPHGNYGIQYGDYNFTERRIVWDGFWNIRVDELSAYELANEWRAESIQLTKQRDPSGNPEREALFFRPIDLGGKQ